MRDQTKGVTGQFDIFHQQPKEGQTLGRDVLLFQNASIRRLRSALGSLWVLNCITSSKSSDKAAQLRASAPALELKLPDVDAESNA